VRRGRQAPWPVFIRRRAGLFFPTSRRPRHRLKARLVLARIAGRPVLRPGGLLASRRRLASTSRPSPSGGPPVTFRRRHGPPCDRCCHLRWSPAQGLSGPANVQDLGRVPAAHDRPAGLSARPRRLGWLAMSLGLVGPLMVVKNPCRGRKPVQGYRRGCGVAVGTVEDGGRQRGSPSI
jgi:hypothetical protein